MKLSRIVLFLLLLGNSSCSEKNSIHYPIQGDWKLDSVNDKKLERPIFFSFQDSSCAYLSPYGELTPFKIIEDTLIIRERVKRRWSEITGGKINFLFKIDSLTDELLSIHPITNESNSILNNYYTAKNNQLNLKRIQEKYQYDIKRIGFYSTACFGHCPSMYLEIDSDRNIFFNGVLYTEKTGLFSGSISENEFEIIKRKINSIDLKNLKKQYSASWTDDQECGFIVRTSNDVFKSSAYGFDQEPIELRALFHKLMEVYKTAELMPDTLTKDSFKFKGLASLVKPFSPPPPQPPIENVSKEDDLQ